ncbi:MAG: hypothetical protein D6775_12985 [Caldilineae bacterium]|nr:MAG: hypothetical protein D6775_12985 [Caldilineae bacterium]
MSRRHLSDILAETARRHAAKEALVFEDQRLTWAEVEARVQGLAEALLGLGVARGDRVGIYCTTRPEYVIAFLATARVGAMLVGFNVNYTLREIEETAAIARPAVFMLYPALDPRGEVREAVEHMSFVHRRIVIGAEPPEGWLAFEALTQGARPEWAKWLRERDRELDEDDGALMVLNGGRNGFPVGAVLTHRNIISSIAAQNRNLGWCADDRFILHLPMNHVSGATLLTVGALMAGATLVMLERFHPERTLELVSREGVTIFGQVPAMWIMEFMLPHFRDYDLSSVRMTLVSGAPTPPDVMRRIAALAPEHVHAWGLTEAAGMVTYTEPQHGAGAALRSAGRAAREFELRVVDKSGRAVGKGRVGEVLVRGDCVMPGYFQNPDETRRLIDADGWLHTGDLGRLDEGGNLTLTGLLKDMYISGGYNVYPAEVVRYLNTHPDIAASACMGVPHPIMGQTGRVLVVPRHGVSLDVAEVRAYCRLGLARYKRPQYIQVVEALPKR